MAATEPEAASKEQPAGKDAAAKEKEGDKEDDKPKLTLDRSKTLWENIAANPVQAAEVQEINVLMLGSKKAGKSTLIQRFLRRDETTIPKPTTALEYCHGRKEEGRKTQTAHFWEVGGGSELHMLSDVVLTPENVHTITAVVVVDLSDPRTMWDSLFSCLHRIEKRSGECFAKMRAKNNTTPDRLLQRHRRKIGEDHPDIGRLALTGIPTVLIATKYDLFHDNPHVKVMSKTLRFVAHRHGMHLLWVSSKDEKDMNKYRALMGNAVFGNAFPEKYMNLDYTAGPLMVWPGRDSFEKIGPPIGLQKDPEGFVPTGDAELDRYKLAFDDAYPPKKTQKQEKDSFTQALYDEFAESSIDALRAQKDEEFRKAESQQPKKEKKKSISQ